ncbi:MAG TPA: hypothetical protein PLW44_01345 [Chitinophagales bacterium]|nr:hypothetical protein [Chitinophagales bacterium]
MAYSDQLHQLIHSLSKTEKKYFKEQSGGQNYVKLFDAINAQPEYDEEKLKKKFKGEAFTNNFSAAKTYLQEAILRSMRGFNSGKLMDDVSYERLQNLKIYHEKGITAVVEKQLPKLKQFCYEYEQFTRLLEVLSFEAAFNNTLIKSNASVFEERKRVIKIISNTTDLNAIYNEMITMATNRGHEQAKEKERIEALMQHPILKRENLCGESDELYALLNVEFVYHYLTGNFLKAYQAKKEQHELSLRNDVLLKTRPKNYLLLVGNLVSLAYNIADLKEYQYAYGEMQKAHELVQGFEGLKFEQRSNFGLLYFKLSSSYVNLPEHAAYVEEGLKKHRQEITLVREMDICFNIAVGFFRKKDFSSSIDWLNKILNHERIEERQQVHRYARQLELLVHYELGNYDLLDYKITNTQRFLAKRKLGDDFDHLLLDGFKKVLKAGGKKEKQLAFADMYTALMKIAGKGDQQTVNGQFEYQKWIETKMK